MGQHVVNLTPQQIVSCLKWSWVAQPLQLFANSFGKLPVISYLAMIHGPSHARLKLSLLWTLGAVQFIGTMIIIVFIFTQCTPIAKLWDEKLPGNCNGEARNQTWAYGQASELALSTNESPRHGISKFMTGLSAFTDFVLAIYPVCIFWSLQIATAKKVVLSALFGCGILAGVCAIVKTVNLSALSTTTDITHDLGALIIWNATEMYIVILAGSVPMLRPFFKRYFMQNSDDPYYERRKTSRRLDDETNLTSSGRPPARDKTYAFAYGKSAVSEERDSTENFVASIGQGDIMMTTKVNVDIEDGKEANAKAGRAR